MDGLGSWRSHKVGAGLTPAVTEQDKGKLADEVSKFYQKQGRGKHCHVDNYLRQQPEDTAILFIPKITPRPKLGRR